MEKHHSGWYAQLDSRRMRYYSVRSHFNEEQKYSTLTFVGTTYLSHLNIVLLAHMD